MTFIPSVEGLVSSGNSSSATLGSGATFTGTAEAVQEYASVTISVVADQNSAASGLQVQFSVDGVTWDFITSFTYSANANFCQLLAVQAAFARVVFTNGSVAQTEFRLQTLLHKSKATLASSSASSSSGGALSIGSTVDAFFRLRISKPFTLLENSHTRGPPSDSPWVQSMPWIV